MKGLVWSDATLSMQGLTWSDCGVCVKTLHSLAGLSSASEPEARTGVEEAMTSPLSLFLQ